MKRSGARALAFVGLLILSAVGLILAFAWPGAGVPWQARMVRELPLSEFGSSGSSISLEGDVLRASGAPGAPAVDLMQSLTPMAAADVAYFRFDAERGGAASQLMLFWQGSAGEGRAALPIAPGGTATLELSRLETWKGEIHTMGLIAMPVDYLPAVAWTESTLSLREARLESRSWRGALGSLATQWWAFRPWTGRSNNTAGTELAGGAGPSLVAFVALLVLISALSLLTAFGRATLRVHAMSWVATGCVVLALWQVAQLSARASSATTARRAVQAAPGSDLSAQPQLAAATAVLSQRLAQEGGRPRVLIHGQGRFLSEYPAWLLREHDVASLQTPDQLPPQDRLGQGAPSSRRTAKNEPEQPTIVAASHSRRRRAISKRT